MNEDSFKIGVAAALPFIAYGYFMSTVEAMVVVFGYLAQ